MNASYETQDLIQRHRKIFPGPQSNLSFMVSDPQFMVKGRGSHIWDTEKMEFIDYMISCGAAIMGHNNEEYLKLIVNQMKDMNYYTIGATAFPAEVELGEKIIQHVPCAERVRFAMTGTEACQLVFRLARAYTNRPYVLQFEEHYHGWLDNVQGGLAQDDPVKNPFADSGTGSNFRYSTGGRDPAALTNYFRIPWNEPEILEKVLKRWGDKVAMVIMEPVWCSNGCLYPRPGYLELVRKLCNKYGIVLCFDEVQTGFRMGLGGAQAEFGIIPDLACYAKAIGGGLPFAAIAGIGKIMDLLLPGQGNVMAAGTQNGYPVGVAAALACIKIMERDNGAFFIQIGDRQKRLAEGLREISNRHGVPTLVTGPRGVLVVHFTDQKEMYTNKDLAKTDKEKQKKFRSQLAEKGVLILWNGRFYFSIAITEDDVDKTLEASDQVMARL